ncbi:class I tRNA ligase family protein, partial [Streptobacillus felis]
ELTTYKQNVLELDNKSTESNKVFKEAMISLILMISPMAPHISEAIWELW